MSRECQVLAVLAVEREGNVEFPHW